MSWLTRIYISEKTVYEQNIVDSYQWHQRLWECFPGMPHEKRDFLTRIDQVRGGTRLWILSKKLPTKPIWCHEKDFAVKEIAPSFFSHKYYAFDVRANPVKTVSLRDEKGMIVLHANKKRTSGKRVPLVKETELRRWIIQKGVVRCRDKDTGEDIPGGYRLVEGKPLDISRMVEHYFQKKGHAAYHGGVQFRGILEVTDKERFIETYHAGIGSAKSFGFGLFLLAPVQM